MCVCLVVSLDVATIVSDYKMLIQKQACQTNTPPCWFHFPKPRNWTDWVKQGSNTMLLRISNSASHIVAQQIQKGLFFLQIHKETHHNTSGKQQLHPTLDKIGMATIHTSTTNNAFPDHLGESNFQLPMTIWLNTSVLPFHHI